MKKQALLPCPKPQSTYLQSTNLNIRKYELLCQGDKVTDKCRDLGGEFKECIQGILQHYSFMMLKFQAQEIYHAAGKKIRQYLC